MSKRQADFQLTSLNVETDNKSNYDSEVININSEVTQEDDISKRKILRLKKRDRELPEVNLSTEHIVKGKLEITNNTKEYNSTECTVNNEDNKIEEKLKPSDEPNHTLDNTIKEAPTTNHISPKSSDLNNNNGNIYGETDKESLPFGNNGFCTNFTNPFVTLAKSEGNFLFSNDSKPINVSISVDQNINSELYQNSFDNNEIDEIGQKDIQELDDEKVLRKLFTGEEDEENIYRCKDVELFILTENEYNTKAFKKKGIGILHLNKPKSDQLNTTISFKQPRIIFRQKGIYSVLLNSPVTCEIAHTFRRNQHITKGFAISFIAYKEDSSIISCMIRFTKESDADDFLSKIKTLTDS
ncbi:hypothetical protein cand_022850 [Cryptosporidium andersoni]|uniref:RanBD1 domain-containing protein n=1 Tax=Cryptosporidium andersoni TaxID=117008 RepID=A0A1J4MRY4_9CRYT|nr:hypothetical protein cand_022850 [Cryptosporidium andersoni]